MAVFKFTLTTTFISILYLSSSVSSLLNSINEIDEDDTEVSFDHLHKLLIVINPDTILEMPLTTTMEETHFKEIRLPFQIKNISAVAYNPVNNTVFIGSPGKIYELNTEERELSVLLEDDILDVVSLDVEVMSENLVFADAGSKKLKVLSLQLPSDDPVAIGIIEFLEKEQHSDVVFQNETHFICNGGNSETVKIVLSRFDDASFLFTNISKPMKSAYNRQRVFKCQINGTHWNFGNNYTLVEHMFDDGSTDNIIGVGNQVFWVDETNELKILTLSPNEDTTLEIIKLNHRATTRKLLAFVPSASEKFHMENQRDDHQCSPKSTNRLYCSHVCLSSGLGPWLGICWCPVDYHMHTDGVTCIPTFIKKPEAKNAEPQKQYITYTYSNWVYLYVFLTALFFVLVGTTVFLVAYWKRTRSFPFVTKPYFTRMA